MNRDDLLARVVEELSQQQQACRQIEMKLGKHLNFAHRALCSWGVQRLVRVIGTNYQTLN